MKGTLLGIPFPCTAVCAFGQSLPLKGGLWETLMTMTAHPACASPTASPGRTSPRR
jgi:hypothetical protein